MSALEEQPLVVAVAEAQAATGRLEPQLRFLAIWVLASRPRGVLFREVMQRFRVSRPTVYRDLKRMRAIAEVEVTNGRAGRASRIMVWAFPSHEVRR